MRQTLSRQNAQRSGRLSTAVRLVAVSMMLLASVVVADGITAEADAASSDSDCSVNRGYATYVWIGDAQMQMTLWAETNDSYGPNGDNSVPVCNYGNTYRYVQTWDVSTNTKIQSDGWSTGNVQAVRSATIGPFLWYLFPETYTFHYEWQSQSGTDQFAALYWNWT